MNVSKTLVHEVTTLFCDLQTAPCRESTSRVLARASFMSRETLRGLLARCRPSFDPPRRLLPSRETEENRYTRENDSSGSARDRQGPIYSVVGHRTRAKSRPPRSWPYRFVRGSLEGSIFGSGCLARAADSRNELTRLSSRLSRSTYDYPPRL